MKFIVALLLTALLSYAGALFFPWWIIAVMAFIVGAVVHQKPFKAFIAGFLALFLLWGIQSFYIDMQNGHLLATKVAGILPLGGSAIVLILVSASFFPGGFVFTHNLGLMMRRLHVIDMQQIHLKYIHCDEV